MLLTLAIVAIFSWLFLWGIFHIAGAVMYLVIGAGVLFLVLRTATSSKLVE